MNNYSTGTYKGQKYVRTQRDAQFRWLLMGAGVVTLGVAGALSFNTFTNEYQQARSLAETAVVAGEVTTYHASIAQALSDADALAAEIGDEVADPAVMATHANLRNQARRLLAVSTVVPIPEDGAEVAAINRDVADGVLAVNAAMVRNLSDAETRLRASHDDYQELVNAKAVAASKQAQLEQMVSEADQVLFDTAPSEDGWVFVPEEIRAKLGEASQNARNVLTTVGASELTSIDDFKGAANDLQAAADQIYVTSQEVIANVRRPEPVIPLDENGNPVAVEAPPTPTEQN